MQNIFGEEREPEPLAIMIEGRHMTLMRGGKYVGGVSPNGWSGKSRLINFPLNAPVLTNLRGEFSLDEMAEIIKTWKEKM